MFQAQNRETNWKVAKSFKIIMTTSVTRPCFTTQHQTCKTKTEIKTTACKTKTDFLVSDRSCPKTDGLRPHHSLIRCHSCLIFFYEWRAILIWDIFLSVCLFVRLVMLLWLVVLYLNKSTCRPTFRDIIPVFEPNVISDSDDMTLNVALNIGIWKFVFSTEIIRISRKRCDIGRPMDR